MRFSLSLPFPSGGSDLREYDDLVALAQAAEEMGVDAVATTDHPFPLVEPGQVGHQALDPFVLHSYIAASTTTLNLHFSLLVAPYRNPFLMARMIGTLDVLSRGRTIVALGAGYLRAEFDALGAQFDGRGALLDRQARAMKEAWMGEPVHNEAQRWSATGNRMLPVPASRPHPRMWRGGNTPAAMRSAVAEFSGWTPFEISGAGTEQTTTRAMTVDTLPVHLAELHKHRAEAGHSGPFETCFVRTGTRWLADRNRAADELGRLAEAELDWLELKVHGRSLDERKDSLAAFIQIVRDSGVHQP